MTVLGWAALAAAGWSGIALAESVRRARGRGTVRVLAAAEGSPWSGVAYAFGRGMSPRAKESAAQHPWTYAAGVLYHTGIAAAVTTFTLIVVQVSAGAATSRALASLLFAAAAAGGALLVRRRTSPLLRAISAADDYASNLLVDAWLVTAGLSLLLPSTVPGFLIATTILGVYAPLGKIRHCVFFFLARIQFGVRIGRRGIVKAGRGGARA